MTPKRLYIALRDFSKLLLMVRRVAKKQGVPFHKAVVHLPPAIEKVLAEKADRKPS